MRLAIFATLISLIASPVLAGQLHLAGPDGVEQDVGPDILASLPRQSVTLEAHGETHLYSGPLLIDLLARVQTPTGKAIHGPELASVVLVTARDGYQVALGLAELDPGTRPNRILLADQKDGKPLDGTEGPYRLVVEGDLRPARSARSVTGISVSRLGSGAAKGH